MPEHPNARKNGYVSEHVLVMSRILGRPLRSDEVVHHRNEDRLDNRPENLEVMLRSKHLSHHHKGRHKPISESNLRRMTSEMAREIWNTSRATHRQRPRQCAHCGEAFNYRNTDRKYCSHRCYIAHRFKS